MGYITHLNLAPYCILVHLKCEYKTFHFPQKIIQYSTFGWLEIKLYEWLVENVFLRLACLKGGFVIGTLTWKLICCWWMIFDDSKFIKTPWNYTSFSTNRLSNISHFQLLTQYAQCPQYAQTHFKNPALLQDV